MRIFTFILLGILLALNIWLIGNLLLDDRPQISIPPTGAPLTTANLLAMENSSQIQIPATPTQFLLPSPTLLPQMVTRTPRVTPTDYVIPIITRQSNQDQNAKIASNSNIIGYSVNDLPLITYSFGSGDDARMIVAGIHGGYEWNTIALADQLFAYLKRHPEIVPPGKKLYILRALNPDGEARSSGIEGRANASGVDLNRNFPSHWQEDWERYQCWASPRLGTRNGRPDELHQNPQHRCIDQLSQCRLGDLPWRTTT